MRIAPIALFLSACASIARPAPGLHVENHLRYPFRADRVEVWMDGTLVYGRDGRAAIVSELGPGEHVIAVDATMARECAPLSRGRLDGWRIRTLRRVHVDDRARVAIQLVGSPLDVDPSVRFRIAGGGGFRPTSEADWPPIDPPGCVIHLPACDRPSLAPELEREPPTPWGWPPPLP